ncbi:hypothetical protein CU048_15455 [Beijerinckiaceae bacterium]|nr:hypothetical protein CU048_15455 [Beijerinckiaceae bacterium]
MKAPRDSSNHRVTVDADKVAGPSDRSGVLDRVGWAVALLSVTLSPLGVEQPESEPQLGLIVDLSRLYGELGLTQRGAVSRGWLSCH